MMTWFFRWLCLIGLHNYEAYGGTLLECLECGKTTYVKDV